MTQNEIELGASKYTAIFNGNGGSDGGSITQTENKELGTLPEVSREGYQFLGWFDSAEGGNQITESTVMPENGATYYAHWKANTYSVKYDSNTGSGDMSSTEFTYDVEGELRENTFEKEGYVFTGWNTEAGGSGTRYEDGSKVENLTSVDGGEVTLYAQWSEGEFTVTLGDNEITGTYGEPIGELPEASKTGYQFLGWFTEEIGGEQITEDSTFPSKDTEYYAQFEANSYTVTYDQNTGMQARGVSGYNNCRYDTEFTLPVDGYYSAVGSTLVGWNTESDGSGDNYNAGESVKNLTAEQNGNVTLYAQWSANAYTVKFREILW